MEFKELENFKEDARDARRYVLIATFLWIGIYVGPSNVYIVLTAFVLMVRGILFYFYFRKRMKDLNEKMKSSFKIQNRDGDFENPYLKYKKNYIEFKEKANTEFFILIIIYVFGFLSHFSEAFIWPSFLNTIFISISAILLFTLLGMSIREIGQDWD